MQFKILGPFEVRNEHGAVALGGAKARAVLAVLLLNANRPVSAERLAQALWGDDAPPGAVKAVQVHVSRLRKALGDADVVETTPGGYRLRVDPGELDAEQFEHLIEDGRHALAAGHPEQAAAVLREALMLWRGSPLAELAFEPFAQAEIARLDEQRLAAVEARVEADLAAGRESELIGELQQLVAANPTRERLAGQLMLALYRCGRQAEALEAYTDARRVLVAEIGVEPGPELRRLHEAILRQEASLEQDLPTADLPRELDAASAPPLEGRAAELAWLRERWEHARMGSGALVTVHGERGIGKSRLSAELAGEVHAARGTVVYAACTGPAETVLGALVRARPAPRPTLVVVDDAEGADDDVLSALVAMPRAVADVPVLLLILASRDNGLAQLPPDGSLLLQPLDLEAVRAIAMRYAPAHVDGDVPADRLLDLSRGVPLRAHELAVDWARDEAARKVGAVAEQAAAGRAELRSMENELAGGIVELQAAGEQLAPLGDDDAQVLCPFKGLASFDVADAPYFFGREQLVAELVARVVGAPLLGVVGPSGSGKSSVVRAGLLPALASGVLPDSDHWTQVLIRPGEHPMNELREATLGLGGEQRIVLAIDQFEETFTVCHDDAERAEFIAALARAAQDPHDRNLVVIALRADYYGRCAAYPELSGLLATNHVLVRPMAADELSRAIELPARRAGLRVEPELTDALVTDTEGEPGALPLLSTALLELWQGRHGRRLRQADYERTGGVRGAVARLAEGAYERLDETQKGVARGVFLRLAAESVDGAVERRRVPLAELETDGDEAAAGVVDRLADQRLLTISAGAVEVAHEALLREWPRLRDWIEEDREGMRVHRRLTAAADDWRRLERDDDALYRGTALTEALEWRDRRDPTLNHLEREFLDAGAARRERIRKTRRRRIEMAFASLGVALAAISVVALVAIHQRRDAQRERNIAISRELALQSANTLGADPELALRLADAGVDASPTAPAAAALREATLAFRQLSDLRADPLTAETAAYSPDGRSIVTGGDRGRVRVWDVAKRRTTAQLAARHGPVFAARYSPRGRTIALGFGDGTVLVTDASLRAPRELEHVPGQMVQSVAFSGDGERVAAGFGDGTVRVLAADGSGAPVILTGHRGPVLGVDVDADGSRVVSAGEDGSVRMWNVGEGGPGKVLHRGKLKETDVRISPDGRHVLAVGFDGFIRFWDAATGAEEKSLKGGTRELLTAAFSRDGSRFAVSGYDGVIRVWSLAGGPPVAVLRGQGSRVLDVGFGRTSDRLVAAGADGTVTTWDAGRTQSWLVPLKTYSVDLSPDGRSVASASDDGTVRIWDARTAQLRKSLPGPGGFTLGLFSPASDQVVIANDPASNVRVWPLSAAKADVVAQLAKGRGMNAAAFDPSGRRIVYVDAKGAVTLHDLRSGREIAFAGAPKDVWDVQVSPDGAHVAAGTESGKLLIWRVDRPERPERALTGHRGHINTVDYSRAGTIVTSGADRTVRVWNPDGGPGVVLRGHRDEVLSAIFTNDGNRVLSTSADGTLRLWDARGGETLAVLQSGGGPIYEVSASRTGKIATYSKGGVVRVFDCEVCGSLDQVRALARVRAPRPLTPAERQRFLATAG